MYAQQTRSMSVICICAIVILFWSVCCHIGIYRSLISNIMCTCLCV